MTALWYLWRCRLRNSLRRGLRRPQLFLPGALLSLGILFQMVILFTPEAGSAGAMPVYTPHDLLMGRPAAFLLTIRGLLLVSVMTAFIGALGEGNAFFEPSDIDFLFTAPLSHRSVLFFKMVGRYIGLLLPAVYLPMAFAGALLSGNRVSFTAFVPGIVGSWLFLIGVNNITQVFLLDPGIGNRSPFIHKLRLVGRWTLGTVIVVALVTILARGLSPEELQAMTILTRSASRWNGWLPDAWAADLFDIVFRGFVWTDLARLGGLALFVLATAAWLFGRERDFYEAATELSARRTRYVAAIQSGDAGAVLSQMAREGRLARGRTLPEFGGGARAILWKDLVAATRVPIRHWLQLLIPAAFPAVLGGVFGQENGYNVLGWTILYSIQMPSILLLTLRDVLRRADISKALPISPLKLLGAELLLPLVQLIVLGWLSLAMVGATGLWRGPLLIVAVAMLPSLAALLFFVQAIFVLIYPQQNDPAQHAISGTISLIVSVISLVPALLVGVPLYLAGTSAPLLALAVSGVNLIGAVGALLCAARLWHHFEPTH